METRFNKNAVRLGDKREAARNGRKAILHGDRSAADASPVPGGNGNDQRYGRRFGTDSYDVSTVPHRERRKGSRIGQPAHRGSGHAKRFGVRPTSGHMGDGYRSEVRSPLVRKLDEIELAEYRGQTGIHGREHRLLEAATEYAATGRGKKEIMAECQTMIDKFDNRRARKIKEAIA